MKKIISIALVVFCGIAISKAQDSLLAFNAGIVNTIRSAADTDSTTFKTGATITDIDGNVYHTVTIGKQVWMVENLKVTKYNDGTAILLVTDSAAWSNLATPGYCWYNNDARTYKNTYGALYNWRTVKTGKLCPVGWHVPSNSDWSTLTDFLGGESVAGHKLNETGTTHWQSRNAGATNESGFTALPGGCRSNFGSFLYIGYYGYWWSSNEYDTYAARYMNMYYCNGYVYKYNFNKNGGCSVRCIRD